MIFRSQTRNTKIELESDRENDEQEMGHVDTKLSLPQNKD